MFSSINAIRSAPATELVKMIRTGLHAEVVDRLAEAVDMPKAVLVRLLDLSKPRSHGKSATRYSAPESERILSVIELIDQVDRMVRTSGNPAEFHAGAWLGKWLSAPHPALAGASPAEYLDTSPGRTMVKHLLAAMQSGAYV